MDFAISFLKWLVRLPLTLAMAVIGRLLAPILPFFVEEDGYLSEWLSWFQTTDNPADGDENHWKRHPGTDSWSTYKRRVAWFWRNVGYGFDIQVLGARCKATDSLIMEGDEHVKAKPLQEGYQFYKLYRENKLIYWQLYFVYGYSWWPSRCIRGNFGWKLWDFESQDCNLQWTGMCNPLFGTQDE